ncbi:MAG: hypothetical protein RLZ10_1735 [Bacteroidota bacterium]|jgi:RHS repeat-associated protein
MFNFNHQSHPLHYPPFGSSLPNRTWSDANRGYRFGFNGKEKENDQDYFTEFRLYNPDLGRWISVDKLYKSFINSYNAFSNSPIVKIDPNGLSDYYTQSGEYLGSDGTDGTDIKIVTDAKVIETIKTTRITVTVDNTSTIEDETYFTYNATVAESTYFTLPPYSDRQEISKIMETQTVNQRYEVGGRGYLSSDRKESYHSRSKDGNEVKDQDLISLINKVFDESLVDENIEMPFRIDLTLALDEAARNVWRTAHPKSMLSYTWHSHPFITVYRSQTPGSSLYNYNIDELPTEDKYSSLVIGGKKIPPGASVPTAEPSEQDIISSTPMDPNIPDSFNGSNWKQSNYVISKGSGTVSHTFKGLTSATMKTDFFYNKQAKKKQ